MTCKRRWSPWAITAVGSVLIAACSPRQPAETATLAAVIRGAQTAELNIDGLPADYQGPSTLPGVIRPALDRVDSELGKYYTGSLLKTKVKQHQDAVQGLAQSGGGSRIGGIRALDLQEVSVTGQSARVKARVTVWFKTAQFWYRPVAREPTASNVIDLEDHLVQLDGTWKIDQEKSRFAPGGGP